MDHFRTVGNNSLFKASFSVDLSPGWQSHASPGRHSAVVRGQGAALSAFIAIVHPPV